VDALGALRSALASHDDVRLAIAFGSLAKGLSQPRSDVDLAVSGPTSPARLAELAVTLSRACGRQVDLVAIESAPPLLRYEIARDGLVLLERQPDAWPAFKARALIDWWDWAPMARRFGAAAMARLGREDDRGPA
jgi:uncharacterized protein